MIYKKKRSQKRSQNLSHFCHMRFFWGIGQNLSHQLNTLFYTLAHLTHFALKTYKKRAPFGRSTCCYSMEARPGFEPGIKALQAYWTIIVYNICPARYIYQLSCKCHLSHFCHMIFRNTRLKVQEKTSSTCNYTMVARAFNANKKYPTHKGVG